jgi:hypothetical protein
MLGLRGTNVMMCLSAFISLCIGIQILWEVAGIEHDRSTVVL